MRRPSAVTGASWQRQAGPSNAAARSARRPQIRVAPTDDGFDVIVADTVVRHCDQEGDAHHWAMHVFEAVNRNVYRPHAIRESLRHLCLLRQRCGTHRPIALDSPSLRRGR